MKKWSLGRSLACTLLVMLVLTLPVSAANAGSFGAPSPNAQLRTAPVMLISQNAGTHTKYMNGSDGWFLPHLPGFPTCPRTPGMPPPYRARRDWGS